MSREFQNGHKVTCDRHAGIHAQKGECRNVHYVGTPASAATATVTCHTARTSPHDWTAEKQQRLETLISRTLLGPMGITRAESGELTALKAERDSGS